MRNEKCPEELAKMTEREATGMAGLNYYDRMRWARLEQRILFIEDDIYTSCAVRFGEELTYLMNQNKNPILITIHSDGGEVQAGLAVYDYIMAARAEGIHVTCLASGMAASMACIILQAGTVRKMMPNARLLIHEVSQFKFFSNETTSALEEQLEELKKIQTVLMDILSDRTGKTRVELEQTIWKKDVWFNAKEALEFGLIDEIMTA